MAKKNDFLPFANNSTSNVIEQVSYESLDARKTGFASGVAKSAQLNKVWRQSSIMSSALAQFISDKNDVDILDDGDVPKLVAEMNKAISGGGASGVKTFNGASGDITISQGNNITITKNGNDFKIAAAGAAGVTTLNNLSGAVNLVAGANVTITPNGNNLTIAASGGGGGAVTSVNGHTGAVVLTAADVGATTQSWVQQQGYATQTWVQSQGYVKCTVSNTWTAGQTMNVNSFDAHGWLVSGGGKTSALTPTTLQLREVGVGILAYVQGTIAVVPVSGSVGSASWWSTGMQQSVNAAKPGGGAWADLSDARTKENVTPVLDCMKMLKALRPVQFSRVWSPHKTEVGFIADEVEKVLPDAVYEVTPKKIYDGEGKQVPMPFDDAIDALGEDVSVKVMGFKNDIFAYMIGGIQELAALVAAQQVEIEELKAKIK